jgi:hypothetical protein
MSRFLLGYSLGFLAWLAGFHCLEKSAENRIQLSGQKLRQHLFKLFLWAVELTLLYRLLGMYRGWILQASGPEVAMAFLVKSVIFLYVKVFWPGVFPEILPGLHVFFCPQCFQKQTFKFLPVSLQYGFFVTYLCRYCSCLVDGWGRQIFYPLNVTFDKSLAVVSKSLGLVVLTLVLGLFVASKIFEIL